MKLDEKITSVDISNWAERRVNLSSDEAASWRAQGERLKERLERHVAINPHFELVKMLNSGSVAKHSALRTISDMDVAVYVERAPAAAQTDVLRWLGTLLRAAYGDLISEGQIILDDPAARIEFVGTGVAVECVPVLYDGAPNNYGEIVFRNGERVTTSISRHIDFFRKRKASHPAFGQFVRLLRYWRNQREEEGRMPLGSFAVELIASHLVDKGLDPSNYPEALQAFFAFLVRDKLATRIVFTDNYVATKAINDDSPVRVIDPVAPENNVTRKLSSVDRDMIIETAMDALDSVTMARVAVTKEAAIDAWREVFGPEFSV